MESETEFIRSSTADDCRDVYALICNMEEKELPYAAFERIFQQQLKDADYACLVYVSDGKVKGCINLRMEYQLHHAERIAVIRRTEGTGMACRRPLSNVLHQNKGV